MSSACARSGSHGASRSRAGAIARGLDVRVAQRLLEAVDDAHHVELASLSIGKDVSDSEVDGLLVEIVGEDNKASGERASSVEDLVEAVKNLGRRETGGNVPVVGIEVAAVGTRPDNRGEAHCHGNGAHAVVNIAIRGTHGVRRNSSDILDRLLCPSQLRNDLLVGQRCEGRVRPGVHRELMSTHVLRLQNLGARDRAGPNHKEGRLDVCGIEVVEQVRRVRRRAVVE